jgi:hypothetical protein
MGAPPGPDRETRFAVVAAREPVAGVPEMWHTGQYLNN